MLNPSITPIRPISFIFVLDGVVEVTASGEKVELHADDFAFLPAGMDHSVQSVAGAGLVVYERRYALKVQAGEGV